MLLWVCTRSGEGGVDEGALNRTGGTVCAVFSNVFCQCVNCARSLVSLFGVFFFLLVTRVFCSRSHVSIAVHQKQFRLLLGYFVFS